MTPVAHRYKSNEEYVYVRGRGRGKYVCEECGIRCKKPSMLKKHIRTHTDVRPYVCKHCHFAFKTKGKRESAGALPLPAAGSSPLGVPAQSSGAQTSLQGAWSSSTSWIPTQLGAQWQSSWLQTGLWLPMAAPSHPPGTRTQPLHLWLPGPGLPSLVQHSCSPFLVLHLLSSPLPSACLLRRLSTDLRHSSIHARHCHSCIWKSIPLPAA